jgi:hypothetical protein
MSGSPGRPLTIVITSQRASANTKLITALWASERAHRGLLEARSGFPGGRWPNLLRTAY